MDGGAWQAAVHGIAKSWMQLSDFTFTFHFHALEKEMATHSRVLASSQGRGSLVGCRLWGHTELDTTEATSQQQTVREAMRIKGWSKIKREGNLSYGLAKQSKI